MTQTKFIHFVLTSLLLLLLAGNAAADSKEKEKQKAENKAYLMVYFKSKSEKLFLAYSDDAKNWKALNDGEPVFDSGVRLRDPFLNRVNGKFHLVHTKGWDHPTVYHWESDNLIDWKGGAIDVVPPEKKRAWAPEFYYEESEQVFYLHWASLHEGHNAIHYVKTKNWQDITPDKAKVYYDIGIHDIDLTIVKHEDLYYGFHKPGASKDQMGNRLYISKTVNPAEPEFAFGKGGDDNTGKVVFPDESNPTEGPEVIKLIGENKWYVYADPFGAQLEAWETTDFKSFYKIQINPPHDAKHCSLIQITDAELQKLIKQYP